MKKKIINGLLMMALVVATTSSFVSCQDTVGDDNARIKEALYQQDSYMKDVLLKQIENLQTQLSQIKQCGCETPFLQKYADLLDDLEALMTQLGTGTGTGGPLQSLADWIDEVNDALDALDEQVAINKDSIYINAGKIDALAGKVDANEGNIRDLQEKVRNLEAALAGMTNPDLTNYATIELVNSLVDAVKIDLNNLKTKVDQLEGKFDNYYTKPEIDAMKQDIENKFANYFTKEEINAITEQIDQKFNGYYTKAEVDNFITEVKNMFNNYYTKEEIDAKETAINKLIQDLNDKFANYYTKEEIDNMKTAVENRITDLENAKVIIDERLNKLDEKVLDLQSQLNTVNTEIETIKSTYATKQELKDEATRLEQMIADAQKAAQDYAKELVDALKDELTKRMDEQDKTIGEMQDAIKKLQEEDEAIKERLTAAEEAIKKLQEDVKTLGEKIDNVVKAQAKQVTGIIVQGTYSPVFGIGKLPVGVQTNILAAYYGRFYKDVTFPAFESTNYVNESDCFTAEEAAVIAGIQPEDIKAGIVLRDADDNAGTLYLTVNPNTVDFTGKLITLENSQGTAAPVTLSPLEKSDYRMNIGWTRAADNGFYEAKAKISQNDLAKAQARVDVEQLKTVAKDLYKNHNKSSIVDAASALYTTVSDMLDAQAAKATYTGLDENGNEQEKSVFSEYGLAVTAITPLSYNTLKNWHPTRIPGFNIAEKFINKLFDNINIKIDLGTKGVHVPTISHIDIKKFDDLSDQWTVKVTIPSVTVNSEPVKVNIDVNGDVYFVEHWDDVKNEPKVNPSTGEKYKADGHLTINQSLAPITVNAKTNEITVYPDIKEQLRLVYNAFAEPLSDVNTTLDNLQDFVDQLNNVLENVNNLDKKIADAKNDARDKVISYLNKIEQKILSKASYVNQALQPVLLVQSGNGYKLLSKMEKYPSVAPETTLSLYATSYNIELLTPAYKKYAVCTGAWKADGTFDAEEAKAVNAAGYENFGKVIDGTEHKVTFTGKAGYKYRIVFQALDYHGKIASMRYYVQF